MYAHTSLFACARAALAYSRHVDTSHSRVCRHVGGTKSLVGVTCTYTHYTHSSVGFYTAKLPEDQASRIRQAALLVFCIEGARCVSRGCGKVIVLCGVWEVRVLMILQGDYGEVMVFWYNGYGVSVYFC